jgi:hypothetical protein
LQNLLFVAERAGMHATARDLRFAIRSAEVELRQSESWTGPDEAMGTFFSRDDGKYAP